MSDDKKTPDNAVQPATFPELKAAFPKAAPDFLCAQLEKSATLDQARAAYQADLEAKAEEAQQKAEAAEKKAQDLEAKAKTREGVDPVGTGDGAGDGEGYSGDPVADFDAAVRKLMSERKLDRQKAVQAMIRRQPELHQAYLLATNSGRRAQRLLQDKFHDAA